ncbi:hypothetical protein [Actibacterium ureilyticum]|nr:hypothetical protein [Actibacterium ureilyticum]
MNKIRSAWLRLYNTWWLWGVLGWYIVITHYPMENVLPVYAE